MSNRFALLAIEEPSKKKKTKKAEPPVVPPPVEKKLAKKSTEKSDVPTQAEESSSNKSEISVPKATYIPPNKRGINPPPPSIESSTPGQSRELLKLVMCLEMKVTDDESYREYRNRVLHAYEPKSEYGAFKSALDSDVRLRQTLEDDSEKVFNNISERDLNLALFATFLVALDSVAENVGKRFYDKSFDEDYKAAISLQGLVDFFTDAKKTNQEYNLWKQYSDIKGCPEFCGLISMTNSHDKHRINRFESWEGPLFKGFNKRGQVVAFLKRQSWYHHELKILEDIYKKKEGKDKIRGFEYELSTLHSSKEYVKIRANESVKEKVSRMEACLAHGPQLLEVHTFLLGRTDDKLVSPRGNLALLDHPDFACILQVIKELEQLLPFETSIKKAEDFEDDTP